MKGQEVISRLLEKEMPDIEQIRLNCVTQPTRRRPLRTVMLVLIIAIIALMATAGVAIANDGFKVIFGRSSIAQVESIDGGMQWINDYYGIGAVVKNSKYFNLDQYNDNYSTFYDVDALREAVPFKINTPQYFPHPTVLERISAAHFTKDDVIYAAEFIYRISAVLPDRSYLSTDFILSYNYVGSGAYLEIETLHNIQKTTVGNCDAALVFFEDADDPDFIAETSLFWIKDGILYVLNSDYKNKILDVDAMIAIAESIK